jgi:16S rRNA (cytidine1402-2'-O)-methyltransferase
VNRRNRKKVRQDERSAPAAPDPEFRTASLARGGTLYLVGTPIGNMEDITLRALRILGTADAVACEDTRVTWKLFERHHIPLPPLRFACHDHNEAWAARRILSLLAEGKTVALCTDGGMPGISDPGYRVAAQCREAGFPVEVVPGPSAVTAAVALSGIPSPTFIFKGFPPRSSAARRRFFRQDAASVHALVLFESPFRLAATLRDAWTVLGDRLAAVCGELTKLHESTRRGPLSELTAWFEEHPPKGEFTVVIAGSHPDFQYGPPREPDPADEPETSDREPSDR